MPDSSFVGQVAVVTGGSRGIGRDTALRLARAGCRVAISYRTRVKEAEEVVKQISDDHSEGLAVQGDLSDPGFPATLIEAVIQRWGRLDILVNNAGIAKDNLVMRMTQADWESVIDVDLRGPFLASKAALKPMLKQRYGRIVNVSSLAGVAGNAGQANYSAAKAGLIGFTRALAKEVGSRNITVNAVAPGFIETEMTSGLPADILERAKQAAAIPRLGKPEDVGPAIVFFASREASYITGQVICIDGGLPI